MKKLLSDIHSERLVSIHNHWSLSWCYAPLWRPSLHFLSNFPVGTEGLPLCSPKATSSPGWTSPVLTGQVLQPSPPQWSSAELAPAYQCLYIRWSSMCLGWRQENISYNSTTCIGCYLVPNHRHSEVPLHFQLWENVTKKTLLDVLTTDCISWLLSFGFW